jgi:SAM-dependent methyltransferase
MSSHFRAAQGAAVGAVRFDPSRRGVDGQTVCADADAGTIAGALRNGQLVVDRQFDEVFPPDVRRVSRAHWTPVKVAMRAARLLVNRAGGTILDVGAGVGKFCIVAAATAGARVRGVEHRGNLVDIARVAAYKLGVDVDFVHGTLEDEDPIAFDGVYLFNPFAENLCSPRDRLDGRVELSLARFWRDVATTERFLRGARAGTRVVTYSGFGGSMPEGYVLALRERHSSMLELWIKNDRRQLALTTGAATTSRDASILPASWGR